MSYFVLIIKNVKTLLNRVKTIPMANNENLHDLKLFSEFFQNNQHQFFSFAYSYIRNKVDAEDILMESIAALWENRDQWKEDSNIRALLLTIIKNKAFNYLSRHQTRLRAEEEITSHRQRELELRISTLKSCDPDYIFNSEISGIVKDSLSLLPEQSRRIFILSRFKHLSNKEIADQLGISVKTVEAHITKTIKVLKVNLKDYLYTLFF